MATGNKDSDFKILERSAEFLQDRLRYDESNPDVYDQFVIRHDNVGSHKYFIEPYRSQLGQLIEHSQFIPLPNFIQEQYSKIECASFMGIIPELNRAWITVDNKFYLWNYTNPAEYEIYDGIAEVIVSIAVSAPRPGVFLDNVKYVLVIATPIEITLLAISCDANLMNIKLIPTAYTLPSDNVTMFKMIGSQSGRVFMLGNDNNLYELDYAPVEESWISAIGLNGFGNKRKCQKINHFAWNWKLVHLIPPFLKLCSGDENHLQDLAVDNVRHVLYTVTKQGTLHVFHLGGDDKDSNYVVRGFEIISEARSYLLNTRTESSPRADVFRDTSAKEFSVVGIFVLPLIESRKAHAMVLLANGIRIYLSLTSGSSSFPYQHSSGVSSNSIMGPTVPSGVSIVYVRSPPSPTLLASVTNTAGVSAPNSNELEQGSVPSYVPTQPLNINLGFYGHGVLMLNLEKSKQPDELLSVYEDLVNHNNAMMLVNQVPLFQTPCFKEGITRSLDASKNSGKIYDVRENVASMVHNRELARMKVLFTHSATPSSNSMVQSRDNGSTGFHQLQVKPASPYIPSDVPVAHSGALAKAAEGSGFGYESNNVDQVTMLGEMAYQHMPSGGIPTQRQFLVLTNQGMHVLQKVRPADLLYRQLSQQMQPHMEESIRAFFVYYGSLQACCMCVALACGLPGDAGGLHNVVDGSSASDALTSAVPLEAIQSRAMSAIFSYTAGPSHRQVLSTGAQANLDTRLVISGNTSEIVKSSAHDALYQVFSRIVRPVWLRPVIHNDALYGAWTVELVRQVRTPLQQLESLLKMYFRLAVVSDPQRTAQFSGAAEPGVEDQNVTSHLRRQAHANVQVEKTLQIQAQMAENASIHKLYRLASRVIHALSLIEILLVLQNEWKMQSMPWRNLGAAVAFRSFAISMGTHDRIKKFLNEVISSLIRSVDKIALADRVMQWLSKECYHYFSMGDRFSYEASRIFRVLKQHIENQGGKETLRSLENQNLTHNAIQNVLNAARYWNSLAMVDGEQSDLYAKCQELLCVGRLGRETIVDVCLLATDNFTPVAKDGRGMFSKSRSLKSISEIDLVAEYEASGGGQEWDIALYHGGTLLTDKDRDTCRLACYQTLIKFICIVARDVPQLGQGMRQMAVGQNVRDDPLAAAKAHMREMVTRAVVHCKDAAFHELLHDKLYAEFQDQLLEVRTPQVEEYLRVKDPMLLYRYYEHHLEHAKASKLMTQLTKTEENLDIDIRISHLQKAIVSLDAALQSHGALGGLKGAGAATVKDGNGTAKYLGDMHSDLKETLAIAECQRKAFLVMKDDLRSYNYTVPANKAKYNESQRRLLDQMELIVTQLQFRLLDITALYNEVATPYRLWEVCIQLLHIARNDNQEDIVARLWRSLIYRMIPDQAATEDVAGFLRLKRDASRIDVDRRHQRSDVNFEMFTAWLPQLEVELTSLGKSLKPSDDSSPEAAFPVLVILEELEEVSSVLSSVEEGGDILAQHLQRGWIAKFFLGVGLSYGVLLEKYMELFDLWAGKSPEKLLQVLSSSSHILMSWTKAAMGQGAGTMQSTRQLVHATRTGLVRHWLEKIRRHVTTLRSRRLGQPVTSPMFDLIEEETVEVNQRIREITMM